MDDLIGYSITYHVALGPRAEQKCSTSWRGSRVPPPPSALF